MRLPLTGCCLNHSSSAGVKSSQRSKSLLRHLIVNRSDLGHKPLNTEAMGVMETRFIADVMLGRLSKWLRVLGYDAYYQSHYKKGLLERFVAEGRRLLSRRAKLVEQYADAVWIQSDRVHEQLQELEAKIGLATDRSKWFSRCLLCNVPLQKASSEASLESVPDYILHQEIPAIHSCPVCGRLYWPGSHRRRMTLQLEEWGF
jgi:uncharacterized protein with PIN domain